VKITLLSYNQLIRPIIIFILLVSVALIPRKILFDETQVVCIHNYLFGFQCPLCGMTRAVYQFTHFQFASALNYNVVVALLPLFLVIDIITVFYKKNWLAIVKKNVVILIALAFLLLYAFRIVHHFN